MDDAWGLDDVLDAPDSSDSSDSSSGDSTEECSKDCALFESAAEHDLYHIADSGKAGLACRLPDGILPRPGGSFGDPADGRSSAASLSPGGLMAYAGPAFRLRDYFEDKLDELDLGDAQYEEMVRGIFREDLDEETLRDTFHVGCCWQCFSLSDGGPRLWWALRRTCPALASFVDLALHFHASVQSLVEAASAGQRVRPAAFRAPLMRRQAVAQGFLELLYLAFAVEDAVGDVDALAALVDAATRFPCARRGAEVGCWDQGFSIELFLAPPPDARQSAAVPGLLFIPAADEATAEAVRIQRSQQRARPSQRRRRRGP